LIKKLVFPNMPESGFDFVLFGERALKHILRTWMPIPSTREDPLDGLLKLTLIKYFRRQRLAGKSRWTFGKN